MFEMLNDDSCLFTPHAKLEDCFDKHCTLIGRVHTDNFTRRAYRSRTVRGGLPVYTLRPLRLVRPVH